MSEVHKTEEETGGMWWRRTKWRKPPRVWYTTGKATPNLRGTVTAGPLRQERRGVSSVACLTPPTSVAGHAQRLDCVHQRRQVCHQVRDSAADDDCEADGAALSAVVRAPGGGGEHSDKRLTSAQDDTRHTVRD